MMELRYMLATCALLALTACGSSEDITPVSAVPIASAVPAVPVRPHQPVVVPQPPDSIRQINDKILEAGQDVLEQGKEILMPDKPQLNHELPRLNIHTTPRNLLNLSTATVPVTVVFEATVLNEGATHPIAEYSWTVTRMGLPFFSQDQEVHTATGHILRFTFEEKAAYRITGTVTTTQGEKASSSVLLWGRG